MKKLFIQVPILALFSFFVLNSCKAKVDPNTNLPKDISERPADENSQKYDQAQLDKLRAEIDAEISKEKCTDATTNEWKSAPIGSKACGGPKSYIAYPAKLEAQILPKIETYNTKEAEFNKKYNVTSDCSFVGEPAAIRCINGKAEVVYPVE